MSNEIRSKRFDLIKKDCAGKITDDVRCMIDCLMQESSFVKKENFDLLPQFDFTGL